MCYPPSGVITMATMSHACYQKMNYEILCVLPSVFLSSIKLSLIKKGFPDNI